MDLAFILLLLLLLATVLIGAAESYSDRRDHTVRVPRHRHDLAALLQRPRAVRDARAEYARMRRILIAISARRRNPAAGLKNKKNET
jgi:hypothetical protein